MSAIKVLESMGYKVLSIAKRTANGPDLHFGDCLDVLKTLPKDSVDALVTDPPAGICFMGKDWDGNKGGRKEWIEWMRTVMGECYAVMKPGSHGLIWALHRILDITHRAALL